MISLLAGTSAFADANIQGTVQSACTITTVTEGVYGNPTLDELSTKPTDGGVHPVVRVDVSQASAYIAKITEPTSFTSSPSLSDTVTWSGDVTVKQVSDTAMADYDTNKTEYGAVHEYDLDTAGSVWLEIESEALHGVGAAFPGGTYVAKATAECIAK